MKKIRFAVLVAASAFMFFSCASTSKLEEGEELVEYIDIKKSNEHSNKTELTLAELREDCDYTKYYMYNCYAGIEEAKSNGFDLDAEVEKIYETMLTKKLPGSDKYSSSDLSSLIAENFSKGLKNSDGHLSIGGKKLYDKTRVRYTSVYFEKKNGGYVVKLSEEEKIKPGMKFTGIENNLFELYKDGEFLYRYGVWTNKGVKSVNISVEGETFLIPVKTEDAVRQKEAWSNSKATEKSLYLSLSDCVNINCLGKDNTFSTDVYEKFVATIPAQVEGKDAIIFDLRSNTGGRHEIPVKMITAAAYYKHPDSEYRKQVEDYLCNRVRIGTEQVVSPLTMQSCKEWLKDSWEDQFNRLSEEDKAYFEDYWKHMKRRPIRKIRPSMTYATELEDLPEPDFKGDFYVLINSKVASASELALGMIYELAAKGLNVHLVGENSWGCVKYVAMGTWFLPNSGIWFYIGSEAGLSPIYATIPNFKGEGKGFNPDVWATNENILDTLIYLTKDESLGETLKGLDKEVL